MKAAMKEIMLTVKEVVFFWRASFLEGGAGLMQGLPEVRGVAVGDCDGTFYDLMIRYSKVDLTAGLVASILTALTQSLGRPILTKHLTESLMASNTTLSAILLVALLLSFVLEALLTTVLHRLLTNRLAARWTAIGCKLIYSHSYSLDTSPGHLISAHILPRAKAFTAVGYLPVTVSGVIFAFTAVLVISGIYGVVGIGVGIGVFVVVLRAGFVIESVQAKRVRLASQRVSHFADMIRSIKAVKLSSWERHFEDLLNAVRKSEVRSLTHETALRLSSGHTSRDTPLVIAVVTILYLSGVSGTTPGDVFAVLTACHSLRGYFSLIPMQASQIPLLLASMRTVQDFLEKPVPQSGCTMSCDDEVLIKIQSGTFSYPGGDRPILRNISCQIKKGSLVAIVGRVGAGKTAMLSALTGGMTLQEGGCCCAGDPSSVTMGYVPQVAYVEPGTVLSNILMGRRRNDDRLEASVKESCLIQDINQLPNGIETHVGESGYILSGGQMLRLNIARAIYAHPSILILDDPLSSVDPIVGTAIFENLLKPYVAEGDRTLIMVVSQVDRLLRQFDHVIYMDSGTIVCQGDPNTLLEDDENPLTIEYTKLQNPSTDARQPSTRPHNALAATEWSPTNQLSEDTITLVAKHSYGMRTDEVHLGPPSRWTAVKMYFAGIGVCWVAVVVIAVLIPPALLARLDYYLADWSDDMTTGGYHRDKMLVYGLGSLCHLLLCIVQGWIVGVATGKAAGTIHKNAVACVLRGRATWHQSNPPEMLIGIFSHDLAAIDTVLVRKVEIWVSSVLGMTSCLVILCVVQPPVVLIAIGVVAWYIVTSIYVCSPMRELGYLEGDILSEVVNGCVGVKERDLYRCMDLGRIHLKEFLGRVDKLVRVHNAMGLLESAGIMYSHMVAVIVGGFALGLLFRSTIDSFSESEVALTITYTFLFGTLMRNTAFATSSIPSTAASLERFATCTPSVIPQEPSWVLPTDQLLTPSWPTSGRIEFCNAMLEYTPGVPPALSGVDIMIQPGWRVGVVGRTGAGKSSLLTLLFRLMEPSVGVVKIDGQDLSTIGLKRLREGVAVIPQEPLIVEGTVRYNLDPSGVYPDSEIRRVLGDVGLDPNCLELKVGVETSCGSKQLLCLARALLRTTKVLVMDEPTSHVDPWSDRMLHTALQRIRGDVTVIMIAHRMSTVAGSDHIIVMDNGTVIQSGPPKTLFDDADGKFHQLVAAAGPSALRHFTEPILDEPSLRQYVQVTSGNPLVPPGRMSMTPPATPPSPPPTP